ncbi:YebC-like protein [Dentipellis sp. KUC8613]|nr:YebC-like protein [Dentipellis sp. KUC8613]
MFARTALARACPRAFSTSSPVCSGHNKWSKIKQRKGVTDAQKSALYGKTNRDIVVAVRTGGSANPEQNIALANTLKKARADGVPKANIETALAKAAGGKDKGDQLVIYEAMAHGSVGVIVECLTDNVNRTIQRVREALNHHNARFATVGFMFQRQGCVRVALQKGDDYDARMEKLIDVALAAEAEDFEEQTPTDETGVVEMEFLCPPQSLTKLTKAITEEPLPGVELLSSELIYAPAEKNEVEDEALESKIGELVGELEETDDILRVWTTLDA